MPLSNSNIAFLSNKVASLTSVADAALKPAANNPTLQIVINNLIEKQALQINRLIREKG